MMPWYDVSLEDDSASPNLHDELPAVEEARSVESGSSPSGEKKRKWKNKKIIWGVGGFLAVAVLGGVLIGVSFVFKDSESSQRTEDVVKFLSNFSDPDALQNEDSPQYRAARFLADESPVSLTIPAEGEDSSRFLQRYALAVFYYATGGDDWENSWNFLSNENECDWKERIKKNDMTIPFGIKCEDEQVQTIIHGE